MPTDITYCGRMDFELVTGNGTPLVTVDVTIRLDVVEFWVLGRNMATFDRDLLADWLDKPEGSHEINDMAWFVAGDRICVCIDGSDPYRVQPSFVDDLLKRL